MSETINTNFGEGIPEDKYSLLSREINKNFETGKSYSVNTFIQFFAKMGFSSGEIKDFIFYLIIKDFFKIEEYQKDIIQSKIFFDKKIKLELKPYKRKLPSPIVISIPPFNRFGFESALKERRIEYSEIKDKFFKLIKGATKEIDICSPFMNLYKLEDVEDLILSKLAEGVTFRIITRELNNPESERYKSFKKFVDRIKNLKLIDKIQIRDYHFSNRGVVLSSTHSKLLIIDKKRAYVGSGEIRFNSFNKNFEIGIVLNELELVEDVAAIFEIIFSKSNKIDW